MSPYDAPARRPRGAEWYALAPHAIGYRERLTLEGGPG